MTERIEHTVRSKQELKDLLSIHTLTFLPREGNIKLLFDHLSENEKLGWEKNLSRYLFECGCDIGTKTAILFLILYLVYLFTISDLSSLLQWKTIAYGFAFVILGSALGKILGLLFYKYSLICTVNKLLEETKEKN